MMNFFPKKSNNPWHKCLSVTYFSSREINWWITSRKHFYWLAPVYCVAYNCPFVCFFPCSRNTLLVRMIQLSSKQIGWEASMKLNISRKKGREGVQCARTITLLLLLLINQLPFQDFIHACSGHIYKTRHFQET